MSAIDGERAPAFDDGPPRDCDLPIVLVHGNCQAESLRQALSPAQLLSVRLPPVHELTAGDVVVLRRWLARASVLISQPIRAGYRGLPIGTADVIAATQPRTAVVIVPVIRFAGLYPEQAIIRPPHDPGASPPLVAYHSLRTLAVAAGRRLAPLRAPAVLRIARASTRELRERELRHGTVVVSDLFARPGFELMRTINHPGNPVWSALAERVGGRLGRGDAVHELRRPLLAAIHAPRDAAVIEAFGLPDRPSRDWIVDGELVDADAVAAAHLSWYARHPDAVTAGLRRHRPALDAIGMR